ncbi:hypothetical protein WP8S17C03_15850 [Metapseudomonas otitidis]|uniref:Metallo-beta-lactamase domain-containing protein n=1 Tax=Metapseudomonas otitidis TaxID=319939 RepID=A0A6S5RTY1_9GAMM|nr:MBL fold metallo-hydrolase [Pseudomonas otitidis]BBT15536.1 hypothetical protein WP8S17C03_15850 [Pseudomonas otitidis]
MTAQHAIAVDLANVYDSPERNTLLYTLAWGDFVEVLEVTERHVRIATHTYEERPDGSILPVATEAWLVPPRSARRRDGKPLRPADLVMPRTESRVLKVNFVDVQQGDGAVIETPGGQVMLVDGGDNQMFARYLAARYRGSSPEAPKVIDCILVTHGDADHFSGLTQIHRSETNAEPRKRLFIEPRRIYHNGLVKRAAKGLKETEQLGPTRQAGDALLVSPLLDSPLDVPAEAMNTDFRAWRKALEAWSSRARQPIEFRRLSFGQHDAFDFLRKEGVDVQVLGPLPVGEGVDAGLPFLGAPPAGPRVGHDSLETAPTGFSGYSASHTINGHSVVFRLAYGGFSYLFCGDLNDEAGRTLARHHDAGQVNLRSEVFKVPHHGSADFSGALFKRVSPVVNVVSSGDDPMNEYIHPRATLMGALGRHSRVEEPLVFVTELVAFFRMEGWARLTDAQRAERRGDFYAFSRTAYGLVKTRTDGQRLLVYTDSGKANLKEAYCYELDETGEPRPVPVLKA